MLKAYQQNPSGAYRPYLRTDSNFWMCGMAYACFWWTLFMIYCVCHQLNRIRIYNIRKRRLKGNNVIAVDLPGTRLLHKLDCVTRVPFVTELIPAKHIVGIILFSIIDILFLLFVVPYSPQPKLIGYERMVASILDRRSAFLGLVNWSFVFFLAQRNSCLTKLSGLTFEELVPLHRMIARVGYLNILPHFIYRIYDGFIQEQSCWGVLFKDETHTAGSIAMFCYIILYATSFELIRRNFFEIFYWSHILFLIPAIAFTMLHYPTCAAFYTPPTLLWLTDRFLRSYKSWYAQCSYIHVDQVAKQTALQDGIVRVAFGNTTMLQNFKPGQYVFAAFVLNDHKLWEYANWHPFTISEVFRVIDNTTIRNTSCVLSDVEKTACDEQSSSRASSMDYSAVITDTTPLLANGSVVSFSSVDSNENIKVTNNAAASSSGGSSTSNNNEITLDNIPLLRQRACRADKYHLLNHHQQERIVATFHIKALGQKTKHLLKAASLKEGESQLNKKIKVYIDGMYGPALRYQDYPTLALFATGIGITPAMAIIKDVINKRSAGVLTYTVDTIYITWAVRTTDEIEPFLDMFSYWSDQAEESILPMQLNMTVFVTRMRCGSTPLEAMGRTFKVIYGQRPQVDIILNEIKTASRDDRVWVHACGAAQFTKSVINEAVRHQFHFHNETFEF